MLYRWIVFLHVLGGLTFVLAHGASAAVDFRIRKETNPERIRALLDVSGATLSLAGISLLVLLAAGVAAGFVGKWWRSGWIWTALGLLIALSVWMSLYSRKVYHSLRKAAGLPYPGGPPEGEPPLSDEEIAAAAASVNPHLSATVGYGALAVILWLMMFKPF